MAETDFYQLLGLDRGADAAAIKASYRKIAMECHPDRNAGCGDSEARFKQVSEAYEVLKDPQKRASLLLQPALRSGWHSIAILRYDALIAAASAPRSRPSNW